jgi:hypothetical protein
VFAIGVTDLPGQRLDLQSVYRKCRRVSQANWRMHSRRAGHCLPRALLSAISFIHRGVIANGHATRLFVIFLAPSAWLLAGRVGGVLFV